MSEHDKIRELLALAAGGALSPGDEDRVALHIRSCADCAKEMQVWQFMARELRRLPTPQPPAGLAQRAHLLAERKLTEESDYRWQRGVTIFVVAFAWALTIVSWPIVRLVTGGFLGLLDPHLNRTWISFAAFTALVWLAGGSAAVLLSLHQRRERRVA